MREADASPSLAATVNLDDPCFAQRSDDMPNRIRRYCLDLSLPAPRTRGETVRLILESLAQAYPRTLRTLEDTVGERLPVLHIVGGGARNELLCRMTADACGGTVVAGPAEATAIGNLLVQASAAAHYRPARPSVTWCAPASRSSNTRRSPMKPSTSSTKDRTELGVFLTRLLQ